LPYEHTDFVLVVVFKYNWQLTAMSIFRSYDIRGLYGTDLTEDVMRRIGAAFAQVSTKMVTLAGDGRTSSLSLKKAFAEGFGRESVDVGTVPMGVGMLQALGKNDYAYITGSHLSKEWNGVKFFHKNGLGFIDSENAEIAKIYKTVGITHRGASSKADTKKAIDDYVKYGAARAAPQKKIDVVLDCGNGAAGLAAKLLFTKAGFNTKAIFENIDSRFSGRGPDPMEDPLNELRKRSASADIGVAYDGDGDRMVIVDDKGRKLTPEQASYLILLDAVKRPGPVIANVECTRMIDDVAKKFGKTVIRVPVGHTFLMDAVHKHAACFGIEVSGHYAVPYMAPFDDSLLVSLYAASVLSRQTRPLSQIIDEIKTYPFGRMSVSCHDDKKFAVVERLKKQLTKEYELVSTLDGVRVDFPDGWILIRASNTGPLIRLTVEGSDSRAYDRLKKEFEHTLNEEVRK